MKPVSYLDTLFTVDENGLLVFNNDTFNLGPLDTNNYVASVAKVGDTPGLLHVHSDGVVNYHAPEVGKDTQISFSVNLVENGVARTETFTGTILNLDGTGTNGVDNFTGTNASDVHYGRGGDDILIGRGGDDELYGGAGNDLLRGDTGNDKLRGGSGDDRIYGGDGNDKIWGDEGNDVLSGGTGSDTFFFNLTGSGNDKITDFSAEDFLSIGGVRYSGANPDAITSAFNTEMVDTGMLVHISDNSSVLLKDYDWFI